MRSLRRRPQLLVLKSEKQQSVRVFARLLKFSVDGEQRAGEQPCFFFENSLRDSGVRTNTLMEFFVGILAPQRQLAVAP